MPKNRQSKKVRIQSKPEQEMKIAGKGQNRYIVKEEKTNYIGFDPSSRITRFQAFIT